MKMYFKIFFIFFITVIAHVYGCVNIITRDEWAAKSPKQIEYSIKPVRYAIIHHTETPECFSESACMQRVLNIQHYHMNDRNFNDIGYNFLIGSDGKIYEGIGWHKIGAHSRGYNDKSVGIAFIGNFENTLPNEAALFAAKKLIQCGVSAGELEENYLLIGARQVRPTTSPGLKLYREIKTWRQWTASP